jgi:hypothetical protein
MTIVPILLMPRISYSLRVTQLPILSVPMIYQINIPSLSANSKPLAQPYLDHYRPDSLKTLCFLLPQSTPCFLHQHFLRFSNSIVQYPPAAIQTTRAAISRSLLPRFPQNLISPTPSEYPLPSYIIISYDLSVLLCNTHQRLSKSLAQPYLDHHRPDSLKTSCFLLPQTTPCFLYRCFL